MRTQLPTSLDDEELFEYLEYLIMVGAIFVGVAIVLYITVIILAISSRKCKCMSTEKIARYHELHKKRAHFWFIFTTIFVSILVVVSVSFGVTENKSFHDRITSIAGIPRTVIPPSEQMVLNINSTVGGTGEELDGAISEITQVLDSVAGIMDSIASIHNSIIDVEQQYRQMEKQVRQASAQISQTQNDFNNLQNYQNDGILSNLPNYNQVSYIDDSINSTLDAADMYLNQTITTINEALQQANTTIAQAVAIGNTEVNKAQGTVSDQIDKLHGSLADAVDSLRGPNATIIRISEDALYFEDVRFKVIIALFVFALVPINMIYLGLIFKVPILYKFAIVLAILCMFWLIAFGGVFTIVHSTFSQACRSRDIIVVNAIHKFTPEQYKVELGNLNIGSNTNFTNTEIIINLDSPTLKELLLCENPTSFFDVFGLSSTLDALIQQVYDALDQLEEQQSAFFSANYTSDYLNFNLNNNIDSTVKDYTGFHNATRYVLNTNYSNQILNVETNMGDITAQTNNLTSQAGQIVDNAMNSLNNITKNVTTTNGDMYSFFYSLSNLSELDPTQYPYSDTTQYFQDQLTSATQDVLDAITSEQNILQTVGDIQNTVNNILGNLGDFQDFFSPALNFSTTWNQSLTNIQNQLAHVQSLMPLIYQNITNAIDNIRGILGGINDNLRHDTQCGFAGDFYARLTDEICVTSTTNAESLAASLLLMGLAYFLICLLGVGLLKRSDVKKLMSITDQGLKRLASIPAISTSIRAISNIPNVINSSIRTIRRTFNPSDPEFQQPNSPIGAQQKSPPRAQDIFTNHNVPQFESPRVGNGSPRSMAGNASPRNGNASPRVGNGSPRSMAGNISPRNGAIPHPVFDDVLIIVPDDAPREYEDAAHPRSPRLNGSPSLSQTSPLPKTGSMTRVNEIMTNIRKDLHRRTSSLTAPIVHIAQRLGGSQEIYRELPEEMMPLSLSGEQRERSNSDEHNENNNNNSNNSANNNNTNNNNNNNTNNNSNNNNENKNNNNNNSLKRQKSENKSDNKDKHEPPK